MSDIADMTEMDISESRTEDCAIKPLSVPLYVETSSLQARLPELIVCMMRGETVVIRHHGETIGYLTPPDAEKELEIEEANRAEWERFREERKKWPKVPISVEEIIHMKHARF